MFSIDAIMSTNLITIPPSATLAEARTLMHDNRIHHIPVVDNDNRLMGAVTVDDVLDRPREACGVFGIYAPGTDVARISFFALYALQHRGQESAGIATSDGVSAAVHKDMGLVSQVFDQEVLERMPGDLAIGHNRYSTTGSSRICNAQPVVLMTRLGPFALAHNGNLVNAARLRRRLEAEGAIFQSTSDTEVILVTVLNRPPVTVSALIGVG